MRVRVPVSGRLRHESDLLIDQLRAIDNRRLVAPLARLPADLLARVGQAMREVLEIEE